MQSEKEQVALTSIAASAALTIAKGPRRLFHRFAGDIVGGRPFADRSWRHGDDLRRGARFGKARRQGASLRPRQGRERIGARRDRPLVPAFGRGDLGGGDAPHRSRAAQRHRQYLGLRRHRRLHRGRFLSAPARCRKPPRRRGARRWKPTRCISRPTCGPRSRCWSGSAASISGWPGRIRRRRCWWPCWCVAPAGGWGGAPSTPSPTPRPRARPRRSPRLPRTSPASSRSIRCVPRAVGDKTFIDLTVAVSRTLPLDRVTAIKNDVETALRQGMPGAELTVTTDPVALSNETVLDRVMVIARNRALAVHHVTVHDIRDRLAVSLDLEVDWQAHAARGARSRRWTGKRDRRRTRHRRRSRNPYRTATAAGRLRPRRAARAGEGGRDRLGRNWHRRPAPSATCMTCACAKPTMARSSTSIAASIPNSACRPCMRKSTRWSALCASARRQSSASSATPSRCGNFGRMICADSRPIFRNHALGNQYVPRPSSGRRANPTTPRWRVPMGSA